MGSFIHVDTTMLRKKERQFRDMGAKIGEYADEFGTLALRVTMQALEGIYGPELGVPDKWELTWEGAVPGSTLGLLTVRSNDPYVIGYEFGTPPHEIWARANPGRPSNARPAPGGPRSDGAVLLKFFWQRAGIIFEGPMVHHPGYEGHHRMPYLEVWLYEVGKYGWSNAVKAAIEDRSYEPSIPVGIPRIFVPVTNDEAFGR